jgi:cytochrome c biogenesis protein CcdA/glutaredoxin
MKKILLSFLVLFAFLVPQSVMAADSEVNIFVFEREDCKHCQDLAEFVEAEEDLEVINIDLYKEGNDELFKQIAEKHDLSRVTPTIFIGDTVIQGYADADTTGKLIYQLRDRSGQPVIESVEEYIEFEGLKQAGDYMDSVCDPEGVKPCEVDTSLFYDFKIPIIGKVNLEKWSLPTMSMVLGFIDGFNPCAMWVLVTFLIVLLQVGDKRKMLQIAGLFIVAEAIMYYLILNVWLGVWDFVGLDNVITSIVGTVAIAGGIFFLWEWKTSDGTCKVTNLKQRQKTTSKIKRIADMKMGVLAVLAIIGLALSVNIIEFACSIGIPQAYTKILDLNGLSFLQTQVYTLLYIIMYMVDDLIVFGLAFYAADKMHLTTKYSKLCNLIGGILMLVLGALLLFAPEMLVF